jgi:ATP-dependent exoDNAse (exonuclease V) beta subunit
MRLADEQQRRRVLTDLSTSLLVEAAAGTGKTSLLAGRVAMLLASGCAPQHIAAITFTELAAGELALRIRSYVALLLAGKVPTVLELALTQGLSATQRTNLAWAQLHLDEITTSTIHGFCRDIIRSYSVETGLDPGSRVIDSPNADAMFEGVFSKWLMDRLSSSVYANDPLAVVSEDDPLGVVARVQDLADLKRKHPTASTLAIDVDRRVDIDFVDAVDQFARWFSGTPGEAFTAAVVSDLQTLRAFYAGCLENKPSFRELWRLAHPARLKCMQANTSALSPYRCKARWKTACGPDDGERFNAEAEQHVAEIDRLYRELRGHIADVLVGSLSAALDDVISAYARRKRQAAALDFDDLLYHAHTLVSQHETVRAALGERYRYIFVDEFQDTDRIQAAIIFLIAAAERPARWQEAKVRPGSLFLVGDPKQAIYRFRGADIEAYNEARVAFSRLGPDSIVHVTANFRSQQAIIDYVNTCFEPVLDPTRGQPEYVHLTATLPSAEHGLPCASTVRIDLPPDPKAATQREEEASLVAQICRRLIGSLKVQRADGSVTALAPGDIALLAPTGAELWRYERALEAEGLSVASQAGKALFLQQETQDILALMRSLADPTDTLAFLAFMRGPMVGLTDDDLLDIAEEVHRAHGADEPDRVFDIRTAVEHVFNPVAKVALGTLQYLRRRADATTPRNLLSEAIEKLNLRVILAARHGNRSARALANLDALIELARPYDVPGLPAFVRRLQSDWELRTRRSEGRVDPSSDAVEIVTIHSSKGLEWPVVIPINTSTLPRPTPQFIHRQSDNTLHWVIGGVTPRALAEAQEEEKQQESLQRERMWYVVCTRARDLLVIPDLPAASAQSWSKVFDLRHGTLPRLDLSQLPEMAPIGPAAATNNQTAERFASEAQAISRAAPELLWRRPSQQDDDRAEALELVARVADDGFEFVQPIGAGQLRGIVLHKLMEELLTGELASTDTGLAERRAKQLLEELLGLEEAGRTGRPSHIEMAETALRTLSLAGIAERRHQLVPEVPIWATLPNDALLAGRADAIAVENGKIVAVFDWKSDVEPSQKERAAHIGQLRSYLEATGSPRGALVYMTLAEMLWVEPSRST